MERRHITVLVLFDFSKAYDMVSHELLLHKLKSLGLSDKEISWIESYLKGRSQSVKGEGGKISNWLPLNAGVPQGLILGPLLFSLFINDVGMNIKHCKRLLYADDLQIYRSCSIGDLSECFELINEDIRRISNWAKTNMLQLNLRKTQAIIFDTRMFINKINSSPLPLL